MVRRLWILLVALVVLVAAACGDGDVGQQDEGDGDGGGGSIEVAAVWTGTEQANFERVLDAFTEETGIDTSYRSTGDDVGAFLGTQIEGGSPPDVAMIPQPGLIRQFADQGSIQEVGDEAAAAARTGGRLRTGSRTSIYEPRARRPTISWPTTRSNGPTRASSTRSAFSQSSWDNQRIWPVERTARGKGPFASRSSPRSRILPRRPPCSRATSWSG